MLTIYSLYLVDLMFDFNTTPSQFQVISTQPEVRIKCTRSTLDRIVGLICLILGVLVLITSLFYYLIEILPHGSVNVWYSIFVLLGLFNILSGFSLMNGFTEILATRDSLIVRHSPGIAFQESILSTDIRYFKLSPGTGNFQLSIGGTNNNSRLDVVLFRSYHNRLCDYGVREPSEWLGRILSDFYQVEFQS
jgi:hypothetical protein